MVSVVALNSSSVCSHCGGKVRNVHGRRHTVEALTAIHEETCPGIRRR